MGMREAFFSSNGNRAISKAAILLVAVSFADPAAARQPESVADVFPDSTIAFVQVDRPDQLIDKLVAHPVVSAVRELEQVKGLVASPQFAMALVAKGMIESKLEEPLLDAVKSCVSQGLAIGVDRKTNGVAVLFRADDEEKLKRLAGSVLNVVSGGAQQQGKKVPFERTEYRDAVAAKFEGFLIARYKTWFLVSNKPQLARTIVDNLIDGANSSLADQTWFQTAQAKQTQSDIWMAVDLDTIRSSGIAAELFRGRTDNPGAELILGGLFDALEHAPIVTGQLQMDQNLELSFSIPFDADWASDARKFFFGEQFGGVAPAPLIPKNVIANLVSYRDVADWWLSKEDLFEEAVIAQLAQADSQLSTIFSGMDFGEDVLGALQPGVQIVAARNRFADQYVPDVKLPSFALVGKLKDPDGIRRKLKIAFQSVIGFANINLGMQGQPQLDLETEKINAASIFAAQYYYEEDVEDGLLLFNFSPTIAFQGPYLIVSSTRELAVELASVAAQGNEQSSSMPNTRLSVDATELAGILNDNLQPMVAANMLEKGNTRQQAEGEVAIMLAIVKLFKHAKLDFQVRPDQMRLDLRVETNGSRASTN